MIVRKAKVVDSTHIELSEPIQTDRGRTVLISVSESPETDAERDEWSAASRTSLENAYSDSEPDYSDSMIKEKNPDYTP